MLMKAIAAVHADKTKALDMFNKGEGGFLERDLYVFCNQSERRQSRCCWQSERKTIAWKWTGGPLKVFSGKVYGAELFAGEAETGRSIHRGELHVSKAGCRQDTGSEGEHRNEWRRSGLRRRLLQVVCPKTDEGKERRINRRSFSIAECRRTFLARLRRALTMSRYIFSTAPTS